MKYLRWMSIFCKFLIFVLNVVLTFGNTKNIADALKKNMNFNIYS